MGSRRFFVSVIVPVYNGEAFLAEAIQSVIRQNYSPLEIILIDDGSTDGTAEIARYFRDRVKYIHQSNAGPPFARNRGLGMARGDVICFIDADDIWSENKLQIQLACLESDPSVEVVIGHIQLMRESVRENGEPRIEKYQGSWPSLNLGGAVIRKSAFAKVGLFDNELLFNDDVDWFIRAKEKGMSILIHKEVVQFYRRHGKNLTNQKNLDQRYLVLALKKSIDRQRNGYGRKAEG